MQTYLCNLRYLWLVYILSYIDQDDEYELFKSF